jgi:hypothetical protein
MPHAPAPSAAADYEAARAEYAAPQGDDPARGQPLDRYEQSQVRFRTVFENAPLGQKIITPDLTICQVNPAMLAMLGFTRAEELVGHKSLSLLTPTTAPTGRSCKSACGSTSCRPLRSKLAWYAPTAPRSGAGSTRCSFPMKAVS